MHTARGSLRLRSRGARCDPELARQHRRSRLARKEARRKEEGGGRGGGGGGGRTTVIKSNNPHLAGGEKQKHTTSTQPALSSIDPWPKLPWRSTSGPTCVGERVPRRVGVSTRWIEQITRVADVLTKARGPKGKCSSLVLLSVMNTIYIYIVYVHDLKVN